jgi:hypothetical protein
MDGICDGPSIGTVDGAFVGESGEGIGGPINIDGRSVVAGVFKGNGAGPFVGSPGVEMGIRDGPSVGEVDGTRDGASNGDLDGPSVGEVEGL